jgi:hypothetical protein
MSVADRIQRTQSAFPAQQPGSVVGCPFSEAVSEAPPPVEVETAFQMTQQILQTMGGSRPQEKPKVKKAWIEIILVDNEGKPMPGVRYRITPPGGAPVEGRLNEHGQAGLYQIEPGSCKITFPDLDKEAWD